VKGIFTLVLIASFSFLSGCELTEEDKEKLDSAAKDLEQLADQIIITSPAKGSTVNQSIVTVRADIPASADAQQVALYVDGIEIAKDTDGAPWEIEWPAYYWADGNVHSLLLKTITSSGAEIRNNEQFQVTISEDATQALEFAEGIDGAQIQDQNTLVVPFSPILGASRYEITDGHQIIETTTTTTILNNLDEGNYSLRYRAIFEYSESTTLTGPWSDASEIVVLPPRLPILSEPLVEKVGSGYNITFNWEELFDEDTYTILLGESIDSLAEYTPLSKGSLIIENIVLGEYKWQLKRTNSLGQAAKTDLAKLNVGVFRTQLGGGRDDWAKQIISSQSGGYIVRATTSSYEITQNLQGGTDDWIIRLDNQGNFVNQYIENKPSIARYRDMIESQDGYIYLVGHDYEEDKGIITKLDASLSPVWEEEILYSLSGSTVYDFESIIEWNNKIFVSALEWGREGNSTFRKDVYLHEVDPVDGSISDVVYTPEISGLDISKIEKMISMPNGNLAIQGYGYSDPTVTEMPSYEGGVFNLIVDSNFNLISDWNNAGEYDHWNIGHAILLNSGRIAVVGQQFSGELAISSLNDNGTEHRYYENGDYYYGMTSLVELSDGTLLTSIFQVQGDNRQYMIKGFNENLIPVLTKDLLLSRSASNPNLILDDDEAIVMLYSESQHDGNEDVVIERIPQM
jgi:hypothetical protein